MPYCEEELTIFEFAERFLRLNDFKTSNEVNVKGIEIFGKNIATGKDGYYPIKKFIVKQPVAEYYFDGCLKGSDVHRIIEDGKEIFLKDHKDFEKITEPLDIVDFEIDTIENYYANGRLNHNTEPGGHAVPFHCSVSVRLKRIGQIISKNDVVGVKIEALIKKNKIGPSYRRCQFNIYFSCGINDYEGWYTTLKDRKVINAPKQAQYCTLDLSKVYEDKINDVHEEYVNFDKLVSIIKLNSNDYFRNLTDDSVEFKGSNIAEIIDNTPEFKDYLYWCLCNHLIQRYKSNNFIDNEHVENNDELDEPREVT